jgi:hypothetical protein
MGAFYNQLKISQIEFLFQIQSHPDYPALLSIAYKQHRKKNSIFEYFAMFVKNKMILFLFNKKLVHE